MPVDLNRIIQAAAEAALDNQPQNQQQNGSQRKRKVLTTPRALLIGAGLATAGRLLARARGGDLMDGLQQRLASLESELGLAKEEPEDEEFDEDEDVEDEPYDEAEDEPEGEYDEEEPEGEYDEEEPEDETDEEPEPERRGSRRAGAGGRRGRR